MIINTGKVEEAKQLIKKAPRPIFIVAKDDEFNRKMIEYGKFDFLIDIEGGRRKDTLRQSDSGLNEYLAKTAEKNGVSLGIDLEKIRKLGRDEKALRIMRIIQNIKLCRKTKTKIKLFGVKDPKNAFSLMISLGSSSSQAKEAVI